jgi:hypothetical protein
MYTSALSVEGESQEKTDFLLNVENYNSNPSNYPETFAMM